MLANIRGGGEYGPEWHQAALREERPRACRGLLDAAHGFLFQHHEEFAADGLACLGDH